MGPARDTDRYDVIVVGAGFTGIYALQRGRAAGLSVLGIEAGDDVGGTWYWNQYPGARCDVESVDYSYSFDPQLQAEWRWTENYSGHSEIHAYLRHVADRFELRPYIAFGERVARAEFDEADHLWSVETDTGRQARANYLIMAAGSLSIPRLPEIPGLSGFAGDVLLTANWPADPPALEGKRIGVVGTGSSALQLIPIVAGHAAQLTVFQRTANYSIPVRVFPYAEDDQASIRREYPGRRDKSWSSRAGTPHGSYQRSFYDLNDDERQAVFDASWERGGVLFAKTFEGQGTDLIINDAAREYVEDKIRSIVADPQTAQDLIPTDHPLGAKRICSDLGYFETYNRDNVQLVNLRREPIEAITADSVVTTERKVPVDLLIFATGFDAMTGALSRIELTGPRSDRITDTWRAGPLTYLGVAVPGFPTLLVLNSVGTPSVLANMALAARHLRRRCSARLRRLRIEPDQPAWRRRTLGTRRDGSTAGPRGPNRTRRYPVPRPAARPVGCTCSSFLFMLDLSLERSWDDARRVARPGLASLPQLSLRRWLSRRAAAVATAAGTPRAPAQIEVARSRSGSATTPLARSVRSSHRRSTRPRPLWRPSTRPVA